MFLCHNICSKAWYIPYTIHIPVLKGVCGKFKTSVLDGFHIIIVVGIRFLPHVPKRRDDCGGQGYQGLYPNSYHAINVIFFKIFFLLFSNRFLGCLQVIRKRAAVTIIVENAAAEIWPVTYWNIVSFYRIVLQNDHRSIMW